MTSRKTNLLKFNNMKAKRKICFVTGTRAEYGLLARLMRLVKDDETLKLQIIATNMHLSPEFGYTYKEIVADGFKIDKKVDMHLSGDSAQDTVRSMGVELIGFADAYSALKPDLVVVLGDRYEILVAVEAALIFRIPVAHLGGGDVTEGAYDNSIRHCITKMSALHFPSNEESRKRIIQMGEEPSKIWNVGATGIDNIRHTKLMSRVELEQSLGSKLDKPTVLVTFHPVTLENNSAESQCKALLEALDAVPFKVIFTMPNSDTGGRIIESLINEYVAKNPVKAAAFKSLGYLRYLSTLQYVDMVIGNSSSGLVEAPSFGIPTVNIGDRQKGRLRAESVIDCKPDKKSILAAIRKAESPAFKSFVKTVRNPYEKKDSARRIYQIIKDYPLEGLLEKHFHQL